MLICLFEYSLLHLFIGKCHDFQCQGRGMGKTSPDVRVYLSPLFFCLHSSWCSGLKSDIKNSWEQIKTVKHMLELAPFRAIASDIKADFFTQMMNSWNVHENVVRIYFRKHAYSPGPPSGVHVKFCFVLFPIFSTFKYYKSKQSSDPKPIRSLNSSGRPPTVLPEFLTCLVSCLTDFFLNLDISLLQTVSFLKFHHPKVTSELLF